MSYSNAIFFMDQEGGNDAVRATLSPTIADNGSGIARCTSASHGLVSGAVVDLTVNYVGAYIISVIDANNFDLLTCPFSAGVTSATVVPRGGSSKADAWKSYSNGASATRIQSYDTVRIMASPDETLVGNATWTSNTNTVTLDSAVTANVCDCEATWTAGANVTSTSDTTNNKEGTKAQSFTTNGSFTTGKIGYITLGSPLDLSAYQQISFWLKTSVVSVDNAVSLRLCSDTLGATPLVTLYIPGASSTNVFVASVINNGSALPSGINSIALYAETAANSRTLILDNIIACGAPSAANALNLNSLIGKVWNRCWTPSTVYAANEIRKPSQPNRNGYRYKVTSGGGGSSGSSEPAWPCEYGATVTDGALTWTCEGLEDSWYTIRSINDTTVKLDNAPASGTPASTYGYYGGASETVATYKREPLAIPCLVMNASGYPLSAPVAVPYVTYSGGWNRTNMTTMTGETWRNGYTQATPNFSPWGGATNLTAINLSCYRFQIAFTVCPGTFTLINCHAISGTYGFYTNNADVAILNGCFTANHQYYGVYATSGKTIASAITCNGSGSDGWYDSVPGNKIKTGVFRNNVNDAFRLLTGSDLYGYNIQTSGNNGLGALYTSAHDFKTTLVSCLFSETTPIYVTGGTGTHNFVIYSQNHNQIPGYHLITGDGWTIVSDTIQRHTASGISWKFRPTNIGRSSALPLRLSVAKIACVANTPVNLAIWTYRDNTNIVGRLKVEGNQVAGVPSDIVVSCTPTINTWVQSSPLTFTPTENGVVEVSFEVYDGVGTTNNFWVDDLTVS
jgi:hypothetical protein